MRDGEKAQIDTATASRELRRELQGVADEVRAEHPFIANHQNAVGFAIFAGSAAAIVALAVGYYQGWLSAWLVVPAAAFFMSLLHELEHDLIHRLYFKDRPVIYNLLMAGVWLFRPSTINPWARRVMHLHHHKMSGFESDMEERAITNGERWGVRRFLMTLDGMLAVFLRLRTVLGMNKAFVRAQRGLSRAEKGQLIRLLRLSYFPLGLIHYGLLYAYVGMLAAGGLGSVVGFEVTVPAWLHFLAVVWLLPNVLRTFCLHFVSSNIHYYGDIEPRDLVAQVQVWTSPWVLPLHAFCFNFGGTHAIHHFVVQEPFYLRQLGAKRSQEVMRARGVRFDDFGTFRRANRWGEAPAAHSARQPLAQPAGAVRPQPA